MPFDRQRRLVFLHVPKTAGTSIEQALGLYGAWDQENLATGFGLIQSRDILARNLSSNFLQHLSLNELESLFPDALTEAQLFTVVRDPWARLLSSFRNPDPDAGLALEALPELIDQLEAKMKESAKKLDFEEAANLRDRVKQLRQKMAGSH